MDSKALKFTRFGALAGHIQHMAAQKVGFTPRLIRYGPPNLQVSNLTALKSALQIRAELNTCKLVGPYPRSMQKVYPLWASDNPL